MSSIFWDKKYFGVFSGTLSICGVFSGIRNIKYSLGKEIVCRAFVGTRNICGVFSGTISICGVFSWIRNIKYSLGWGIFVEYFLGQEILVEYFNLGQKYLWSILMDKKYPWSIFRDKKEINQFSAQRPSTVAKHFWRDLRWMDGAKH